MGGGVHMAPAQTSRTNKCASNIISLILSRSS